MSCDHTRGVIAVWDPSHDLPDAVVDHLERCAACAAAFDTRFPPVSVPTPERGVARRSRPATAWIAAAALAMFALPWGSLAPSPAASADVLALSLPDECPQAVELPPECPPA